MESKTGFGGERLGMLNKWELAKPEVGEGFCVDIMQKALSARGEWKLPMSINQNASRPCLFEFQGTTAACWQQA